MDVQARDLLLLSKNKQQEEATEAPHDQPTFSLLSKVAQTRTGDYIPTTKEKTDLMGKAIAQKEGNKRVEVMRQRRIKNDILFKTKCNSRKQMSQQMSSFSSQVKENKSTAR